MIRRLSTGVDEKERGFTLVELMVVILIIAILVAIAITVFWTTRERATDRAAQALLTNGVKAVEVVRSDDERLSTVTTAQLDDAEPQVAWLAETIAAEAREDEISVAAGTMGFTEGVVVLSTHTVLGDCLAIRVRENGAAMYLRVAGDVCPADAFDPETALWLHRWPPR